MRTTSRNNNQNPSEFNCSELNLQFINLKIDALAKTNNQKSKLWEHKGATHLLLALMTTGIGLLSGCAVEFDRIIPSARDTSPQVQRTEEPGDRPLTPTPEDTNFVVAVVEKVEPAVVRINTARTVRPELPEVFNDPFFRRFFGDRIPTQPQERVVRGVGSGFVINPNGQILTNAHVVNDADTVTVTFSNGQTFEGKVLGTDTVSDIAVVQVPAQNLPTLELGNSEQVRPGQWAIAIGNPLGLQETVTVGVVSAVDRSVSDFGISDRGAGFIQTDAAINPGNSGGPLLNARGQVIGVNTAIIQGAQGIGFAIPIDRAQRIAQQLITEGKVEYPYIGIEMVSLTPDVRQRINNLPNSDIRVEADRGVVIIRVVPGSPADRAGLRSGDVIQQINNQPVTTAEEIQQIADKSGIGSNLQIQLLRNGQTQQVTVQLAPRPAQNQ
ncbi:MAG: trypsin-like peptidase domain-containing protein [Fischerella sp.]|jgi:S1-C subfamily serine protease|uniref:HhoA/HhoB/HtrA family serine endopeptidase n=1 Tax=Fischerella sp. TaxID=1191 RepID=UPI0018105C87|nr:HhoA/HhoB/HtrA family serine endopeptidase [Fischerella sp.]NWF60207.1 trypsin-like peptidase domain-containing protein [Fischerella sp.]